MENNISAEHMQAFKSLIKRYKELANPKNTEIKDSYTISIFGGVKVMRNLTGFGSSFSCTLCLTAPKCNNCLYFTSDWLCSNHDTYDDIYHAKSVTALKKALRARVKYMESVLKSYNESLSK